MKILILIAIALTFLFSYGCVTKEYVKQQDDLLADRISKIEAAQNESGKNADAAAKSANASASRAEAAADRAEAALSKSKKAFELQQKK
ncbi:MAG: hypothetical protein L0Y62_02610 [Nitrospirae bacterium]|nr:hypothetical protein [Nitrospirota bacterium]